MNADKMKTVRTVHLLFTIINILLLIIAVVTLIGSDTVVSSSAMIRELLLIMINIVALIISIIYVASGYKKDAAIYYKATICLLLLSLFIRTVLVFIGRGAIVDAILHTIAMVMLMILFLNKDFGERNTWIVYGILMTCLLFQLALTLFTSFSLYNLADRLALFACAGTLGIMIRAKYLDKKARHTT